ncbi:MAG: tetratricopeptide repeat protein [Deltaproteobacteria bacterium]|nr:tetratricopeptide repeat protein [Deltaproteobacteria bacterium]MBW2018474.1 tetratricopeptide repeat protein [Deltaproteobacteria bacterium]MBW2074131.1 tetratricopeptide repeat protein [Deltaproteobacteria bacterium]
MKPKISINLLIVGSLTIASFMIYANTLSGDFVWDDRALFVEHYDLWKFENIRQLLTSQDNLFEDRYTGYYRPFPNLTFLVDRYLWGQNPSGYHLTNIIFHVLSTLCVYWVALILFRHRGVAFLGAICFAWHPVHTEDIAWINGRNNVLSGLFYLLSFALYLKFTEKEKQWFTYYGLSLLAFSLSLLSKEYALTFPLIVACYEYSFRQAGRNGRILSVVCRIVPYIIIIFAYLAIRSMVLPAHGIKFMHWETFWMRLLTLPKTLTVYLRLLLLPVNLTVRHETTLISSVIDPVFWLTLGIALCFGFLLYYTYHWSRAAFLMLAWIILTLIPVLNLIPLSDEGTFIAERYLYLPSVGFCIIVALFMVGCWHVLRGRKQKLILWVFVLSGSLLLQCYAFGTLNRNLAWRTELFLWSDAVAYQPRSHKPYFNLAVAYRDTKKYEAAIGMFEKAYWMASMPEDRGLILGNIAYVYYLLEVYDLAEINLKEAVTLFPGNTGIYNLLGNVYFMQHDFARALEQYRKVLKIDPNNKDALLNIGMAYFKMGEMDRVITHLERAKSMLPDDGKLYYYLGSAYDRKGMAHEAAKYYGLYLKRLPHDANYQKVICRLKKMEAAP